MHPNFKASACCLDRAPAPGTQSMLIGSVLGDLHTGHRGPSPPHALLQGERGSNLELRLYLQRDGRPEMNQRYPQGGRGDERERGGWELAFEYPRPDGNSGKPHRIGGQE